MDTFYLKYCSVIAMRSTTIHIDLNFGTIFLSKHKKSCLQLHSKSTLFIVYTLKRLVYLDLWGNTEEMRPYFITYIYILFFIEWIKDTYNRSTNSAAFCTVNILPTPSFLCNSKKLFLTSRISANYDKGLGF